MSLLNALFPTAQNNTAACATSSGTCNCNDQATVRPHYTVSAGDDVWTLRVQLPGITKTGLAITDEAGVLTIRGERTWKQPEGWTALYRESDDTTYELALRHDGEIDVEKIRADFADGLLIATLPKAEAIKPRKITVN